MISPTSGITTPTAPIITIARCGTTWITTRGRTANWGEEWIDANVGSELERLTTGNTVAGYDGCSSCAHCEGPGNKARINCVLKGRALWWLLGRLAGWNGNPIGAPTPSATAAVPVRTPTPPPSSGTPTPASAPTAMPGDDCDCGPLPPPPLGEAVAVYVSTTAGLEDAVAGASGPTTIYLNSGDYPISGNGIVIDRPDITLVPPPATGTTW